MEEIKNQKLILNSLEVLADEIAKIYHDIPSVVRAIQKNILDHAHSLPERYEPKSIIESRFTPADEAFEKGILSCGAMANMAAAMLRHLGYKVKLVHGESKESVDHAWISVLDPVSGFWNQYDLTREGAKVPSTNIVKREVDSWEDIRDQIMEDHHNLRKRRKARGIS